MNAENFWLLLGFSGQLFFTSRFLMQWLASERQKRSVIPVSFWILSIVGSLMLLIYSIYRKDPVFIIGQCFGFIVYGRNLYFIYVNRKCL